jgi:hypothetical protein
VLNTNATVRGEYYLRLSKAAIKNFGSDKASLHLKKEMIDADMKNQLTKVDFELLYVDDEIKIAEAGKVSIANQTLQGDLDYRKYKDSLQAYQSGKKTNLKRLKFIIDTVESLQSKLVGYQDEKLLLDKKIDSLNYVKKYSENLRDFKRNEINEDTRKKIEELEQNAPITSIRYGWMTFIGGLGKKNYYTYDVTLSFGQQIDKKEFSTYTYGLAYMHYNENVNKKEALYFNIGALRIKDNNALFLSTKEIKQERKITSNDTTRTISKTYNAYTDPINELKQVTAFANFFYLFNGKKTGIHFYPSADIRDKGPTLTNLGLGCAMSFVNAKKDQAIINIEGYVQFIDMFNKLDNKPRFWNRNEIGVRFAFPFSFTTSKLNIDEKESK